MKNALYSLLLLVVVAGCNKYEDGPGFSLEPKKARLVNEWQMSSAYQNGADRTADFNAAFAGYLLDIRRDNTYTLSYSPYSVGSASDNGHWEFNSDKTHVIFTNSNGDASDYQILRLKEKELWVRYHDSGDEWEVHLVPKS